MPLSRNGALRRTKSHTARRVPSHRITKISTHRQKNHKPLPKPAHHRQNFNQIPIIIASKLKSALQDVESRNILRKYPIEVTNYSPAARSSPILRNFIHSVERTRINQLYSHFWPAKFSFCISHGMFKATKTSYAHASQDGQNASKSDPIVHSQEPVDKSVHLAHSTPIHNKQNKSKYLHKIRRQARKWKSQNTTARSHPNSSSSSNIDNNVSLNNEHVQTTVLSTELRMVNTLLHHLYPPVPHTLSSPYNTSSSEEHQQFMREEPQFQRFVSQDSPQSLSQTNLVLPITGSQTMASPSHTNPDTETVAPPELTKHEKMALIYDFLHVLPKDYKFRSQVLALFAGQSITFVGAHPRSSHLRHLAFTGVPLPVVVDDALCMPTDEMFDETGAIFLDPKNSIMQIFASLTRQPIESFVDRINIISGLYDEERNADETTRELVSKHSLLNQTYQDESKKLAKVRELNNSQIKSLEDGLQRPIPLKLFSQNYNFTMALPRAITDDEFVHLRALEAVRCNKIDVVQSYLSFCISNDISPPEHILKPILRFYIEHNATSASLVMDTCLYFQQMGLYQEYIMDQYVQHSKQLPAKYVNHLLSRYSTLNLISANQVHIKRSANNSSVRNAMYSTHTFLEDIHHVGWYSRFPQFVHMLQLLQRHHGPAQEKQRIAALSQSLSPSTTSTNSSSPASSSTSSSSSSSSSSSPSSLLSPSTTTHNEDGKSFYDHDGNCFTNEYNSHHRIASQKTGLPFSTTDEMDDNDNRPQQRLNIPISTAAYSRQQLETILATIVGVNSTMKSVSPSHPCDHLLIMAVSAVFSCLGRMVVQPSPSTSSSPKHKILASPLLSIDPNLSISFFDLLLDFHHPHLAERFICQLIPFVLPTTILDKVKTDPEFNRFFSRVLHDDLTGSTPPPAHLNTIAALSQLSGEPGTAGNLAQRLFTQSQQEFDVFANDVYRMNMYVELMNDYFHDLYSCYIPKSLIETVVTASQPLAEKSVIQHPAGFRTIPTSYFPIPQQLLQFRAHLPSASPFSAPTEPTSMVFPEQYPSTIPSRYFPSQGVEEEHPSDDASLPMHRRTNHTRYRGHSTDDRAAIQVLESFQAKPLPIDAMFSSPELDLFHRAIIQNDHIAKGQLANAMLGRPITLDRLVSPSASSHIDSLDNITSKPTHHDNHSITIGQTDDQTTQTDPVALIDSSTKYHFTSLPGTHFPSAFHLINSPDNPAPYSTTSQPDAGSYSAMRRPPQPNSTSNPSTYPMIGPYLQPSHISPITSDPMSAYHATTLHALPPTLSENSVVSASVAARLRRFNLVLFRSQLRPPQNPFDVIEATDGGLSAGGGNTTNKTGASSPTTPSSSTQRNGAHATSPGQVDTLEASTAELFSSPKAASALRNYTRSVSIPTTMMEKTNTRSVYEPLFQYMDTSLPPCPDEDYNQALLDNGLMTFKKILAGVIKSLHTRGYHHIIVNILSHLTSTNQYLRQHEHIASVLESTIGAHWTRDFVSSGAQMFVVYDAYIQSLQNMRLKNQDELKHIFIKGTAGPYTADTSSSSSQTSEQSHRSKASALLGGLTFFSSSSQNSNRLAKRPTLPPCPVISLPASNYSFLLPPSPPTSVTSSTPATANNTKASRAFFTANIFPRQATFQRLLITDALLTVGAVHHIARHPLDAAVITRQAAAIMARNNKITNNATDSTVESLPSERSFLSPTASDLQFPTIMFKATSSIVTNAATSMNALHKIKQALFEQLPSSSTSAPSLNNDWGTVGLSGDMLLTSCLPTLVSLLHNNRPELVLRSIAMIWSEGQISNPLLDQIMVQYNTTMRQYGDEIDTNNDAFLHKLSLQLGSVYHSSSSSSLSPSSSPAMVTLDLLLRFTIDLLTHNSSQHVSMTSQSAMSSHFLPNNTSVRSSQYGPLYLHNPLLSSENYDKNLFHRLDALRANLESKDPDSNVFLQAAQRRIPTQHQEQQSEQQHEHPKQPPHREPLDKFSSIEPLETIHSALETHQEAIQLLSADQNNLTSQLYMTPLYRDLLHISSEYIQHHVWMATQVYTTRVQHITSWYDTLSHLQVYSSTPTSSSSSSSSSQSTTTSGQAAVLDPRVFNLPNMTRLVCLEQNMTQDAIASVTLWTNIAYHAAKHNLSTITQQNRDAISASPIQAFPQPCLTSLHHLQEAHECNSSGNHTDLARLGQHVQELISNGGVFEAEINSHHDDPTFVVRRSSHRPEIHQHLLTHATNNHYIAPISISPQSLSRHILLDSIVIIHALKATLFSHFGPSQLQVDPKSSTAPPQGESSDNLWVMTLIDPFAALPRGPQADEMQRVFESDSSLSNTVLASMLHVATAIGIDPSSIPHLSNTSPRMRQLFGHFFATIAQQLIEHNNCITEPIVQVIGDFLLASTQELMFTAYPPSLRKSIQSLHGVNGSNHDDTHQHNLYLPDNVFSPICATVFATFGDNSNNGSSTTTNDSNNNNNNNNNHVQDKVLAEVYQQSYLPRTYKAMSDLLPGESHSTKQIGSPATTQSQSLSALTSLTKGTLSSLLRDHPRHFLSPAEFITHLQQQQRVDAINAVKQDKHTQQHYSREQIHSMMQYMTFLSQQQQYTSSVMFILPIFMTYVSNTSTSTLPRQELQRFVTDLCSSLLSLTNSSLQPSDQQSDTSHHSNAQIKTIPSPQKQQPTTPSTKRSALNAMIASTHREQSQHQRHQQPDQVLPPTTHSPELVEHTAQIIAALNTLFISLLTIPQINPVKQPKHDTHSDAATTTSSPSSPSRIQIARSFVLPDIQQFSQFLHVLFPISHLQAIASHTSRLEQFITQLGITDVPTLINQFQCHEFGSQEALPLRDELLLHQEQLVKGFERALPHLPLQALEQLSAAMLHHVRLCGGASEQIILLRFQQQQVQQSSSDVQHLAVNIMTRPHNGQFATGFACFVHLLQKILIQCSKRQLDRN